MNYKTKRFGQKQCSEEQYPNGMRIFFSYATPVGAYVPGLGYLKTVQHYSRTTTRQIGHWLKEYDYPHTQPMDERGLWNLRDECLRMQYE